MKKLFLSIIAVAVVAVSANAQIDRTKNPGPGPLPKAAMKPFKEFTLKNGLRVVIVEDHKQPVVYFRTLVLSGNAQDGHSLGAAAAVADQLEKGTKTMSADDIAKKLDFYGAQLGTTASVDDINITTGFLKRDMDKVLPIYSDVIKNPLFPTNELEKYKTQQLSNLKAARQSPTELGRKMGRKLVYDGHPYGNFQTDSTIKALTQGSVVTWHKEHFVASNTIIAVVGDISEAEMKPVLEKYFGSWDKGSFVAPGNPPLEAGHGLTISLIDRPGSAQSTIRLQRLGLPVRHPDFDKASIIMSIFAGNGVIGFQNRLFQNIREKHGYTYTPGGSITKSIDPGVIVAVAEVRNSVTDSALEQMRLEYRRLANEPISDQELNFAKGLIAGKFMMDLADPQTTSALALSTLEYGLPKDYYATFPDRISKYTAAELQDVARRVFPPEDIHVIVIGDASQVLSKLQRFGKVKVYDLDLNPKAAVATKIDKSDKTVDQVLDKMYAGLNKPAYEKIKTRKIEGTLELELGGGNRQAKYEEIKAVGNKKYSKLDLGAPVVIETIVDGQTVYQYQMNRGGAADPATTKDELNDAVFNEELHLKDPGYALSLKGVGADMAGPAYVLDITKPSGIKETWYIDTASGYITRREFTTSEGASIQDFSNFKTIEGIPYAFTISSHGAGDHTIELTSVQHNIAVDEKLFQKKP
jgi:zinc protease